MGQGVRSLSMAGNRFRVREFHTQKKPPYAIGGLPQAYSPKANSSGTKHLLLNRDCSDANGAVLAAIIVIITIIICIASIMIGFFETIDERLLGLIGTSPVFEHRCRNADSTDKILYVRCIIIC